MLQLYAHPLSSYCQKVLVALYENAVPFELRLLGPGAPAMAELAERWPLKRFPVLVDGSRTVIESSCIVEYLQLAHPGPVRLIPEAPLAALDVRFLDRFFDNYVSTPQQRIVSDVLRPPDKRDPLAVADARSLLDAAYAWLERHLRHRTWAAGEDFTLADCGAAPFLFYAHCHHPIDAAYPVLRAYRKRLLARPSFARAVDEARQYRHLFPGTIPEGE